MTRITSWLQRPSTVATLAVWLIAYGTITFQMYVMGIEVAGQLAVRRIFTVLFAMSICFAADEAFRRYPAENFYVRIAGIIAFSAFGSIVWNVFNAATLMLPPALFKPTRSWFYQVFPNLQWGFWVFLAWSGIWFALDSRDRMAKKELELANSQLAASEAQNLMLRYQLNPHFMFNALSAIATTVTHEDPRKAEQAILSLSRFLRASYHYAPAQKIPLEEELSLAEEYMAVERTRFEDRLVLRTHISAEANGALVPNLILQPLLENAIKHGVSRTLARVTVTVAAAVRGGRLALCVSDDAVAATPKDRSKCSGVGLANIRQRVDSLYEGKGSFSAGRGENGFEAVIELPLETES